jgi:predicted naringenin-chalcone synthase
VTGSVHFTRRLAVALGAHSYAQDALADDLRARVEAVPDSRSFAQMIGFVFDHSAIRTRHLELSIEEIDQRDDWYRAVNQANHSLALRVLAELFAGDTAAAECDALIVVSSSYAGFPSLSRRLLEPLGFALDTLCFDLAGLGCAGPTHGIMLADALLGQGRCTTVCIVCVDAMATHGQFRRHTKVPTMAQLVAHALASDGAAALLMTREPGRSPIFAHESCRLTSQQWSGSLDQNDFTADEDNQPMLSVGKDIRTRIGPELDKILDEDALGSPIFFHPGGAALMRTLKASYPQLADSVDLSMTVLTEHGNLGAASLLCVLDRVLVERAVITPRFRLLALGPGIVTTSLLLEGVH